MCSAVVADRRAAVELCFRNDYEALARFIVLPDEKTWCLDRAFHTHLLGTAARLASAKMMEQLIQWPGVDLNHHITGEHLPPLHTACECLRPAVVRLLLRDSRVDHLLQVLHAHKMQTPLQITLAAISTRSEIHPVKTRHIYEIVAEFIARDVSPFTGDQDVTNALSRTDWQPFRDIHELLASFQLDPTGTRQRTKHIVSHLEQGA